MKEPQLKPIKHNPEQTKEIKPEEIKQVNEINQSEVINELPTWNIEPPLEIKRGN